jgi:hypothetical protein
MKNGESKLTKDQRIINRTFILNHLDDIIKESVYYRTNADNISEEVVAKINIYSDTKVKIL